MTDDRQLIEADALRDRDRRDFFRSALGAAAVTTVGAAALTVGSGAFAQSVTDSDVLNFILSMKYLQSQFYNYAAFGTGLPATSISGTGTAGDATGARKATFTDPLVARYAAEMATDKAGHVTYLRGVLGAVAVAQPAIDLGTAATGAFSLLMGAAGVVTKGSSFDPYANDSNFLLAAFAIEDVVTSALRALGTATIITDKTNIENVSGMLGTDAYHAALIRTTLYIKGAASGSTLRANTESISNVRDQLDGTADDDQGVAPTTDSSGNLVSNIVPAGPDGVAFARTPALALNIFYLNSASVSKGGFFPNGLNGTVVASNAN